MCDGLLSIRNCERQSTRSKRPHFFLICVLLVAVVLGCSSCSGGSSGPYSVTFEVTGTAIKANLIGSVEWDYIIDQHDVPLPWSCTFTGADDDWVNLFAADPSGGTVTVTIYRDSKVFLTATNAPGGAFEGENHAEVGGEL